MDTDKPTVVDSHAVIEGKLRGKDVHILGRFRGEIELSGRLLLGEGSHVEAKVTADQADIAGQFNGELKVRQLILLEKARVEGTLEAQSLAVREGAQLNGAINSGLKPDAAGRAAAGEARPGPGAAPDNGGKGEPGPGPRSEGLLGR